jgi:signal transduction histidine kinase/ActR/RegA family two-component response regulator
MTHATKTEPFAYPVASDEPERLAALAATGLLDSDSESSYDDIVLLASRICGTPIALVTLVDRDRQWFKARVGLERKETPRSLAFCNYPVAEKRTWIVRDAIADPRFQSNALVTGEPHIRFYAGAPLMTAQGHALGSLCVIDTAPRDLSAEQVQSLEALARQVVREIQMREHLRELRKAKEQAQEASASKSQFLANMSHEIRTPMTAILGYADLLEDAHLPQTQRESFLQTIRHNGRHLLKLINDILDLSKIEANKVVLEEVPCSPRQLVTECAASFYAAAEQKGIVFSIEFLSEIPEVIQADPTRLRQILLNLLSNALKFTQSGSIRLSVRQEHTAAGKRLAFEIVDTGIGLTPEQLERLFQPFTQADSTTTRKFGGTGLGLVISRRLAQAMGGDIDVRSTGRCGEGTTAAFRMPIHLAESATPAPAEMSSPVAVAAERARLTGSILFAEDGVDNQMLIQHVLRRAGAKVTLAENGRIAVEKVLRAVEEGTPFDLILMDMQMPELDGYDATRQLRSKGIRTPIVALTANAMAGDREQCLAAGCDDFATKPVDVPQLVATLCRLGGA